MSKPRVVCLDLSGTVGFSFWDGYSHIVNSGSYSIPKSEWNNGLFFVRYRKFLDGLRVQYDFDTCIIEAPILVKEGPKSTKVETAMRLMGLVAVSEYLCEVWGISRVFTVDHKAVRRDFLGQGNVPVGRDKVKAAVIAECKRRGWNPIDDNEADALAMLDHYARFKLKAECTWPARKGGLL